VARVFVARVFVARVFVGGIFVARVFVARVFVGGIFVARVFVAKPLNLLIFVGVRSGCFDLENKSQHMHTTTTPVPKTGVALNTVKNQ
jgi:hypothetical protein